MRATAGKASFLASSEWARMCAMERSCNSTCHLPPVSWVMTIS